MENIQLTGFGNPLLDISANVNEEFLKTYDMEPGGIILETVKQKGIYEDLLAQPGVEMIPGGATLNSLRVFEALDNRQGTTFYAGCVGEDKHGVKIQELCTEEKILVNFAFSHQKSATGLCGVMVMDKERALCTRLGAANDFKISHLDKDDVWASMKAGVASYISGYVLTVCPEGMMKIANHCLETDKLFAMNLSAPFIVEVFKEPLMKLYPLADCVMGNEHEWRKFGEVNGCPAKDLEGIARFAVNMPWEGAAKRKWPSRWVVITQGNLDTIVAHRWAGEGIKLVHYPVKECTNLVDTNAAGDAFAGGFMYGIVKIHQKLMDGHSGMDAPVAFGHYTARHIIQRSGCQMQFKEDDPERPNF